MNKVSGSDGIPVELFQILKDDAVKVLHSICQQMWKTQQWPQDRKRSVFIPIPKAMPKNAQTTAQLHSFHMLVKQCSKFSKPGFNSMWTVNFQMFKLDLEKAGGTRNQIANICWIIEKAREFKKNIYFGFTDYGKALDCVDHNKLWKILKEMGIPDHLTCLLRNLYAGQEATVRTGHGESGQDGGGIGPGDHFLFYKFIERTTERWTKFTKQLLIASSGHQAPSKAAYCLWREVRQKY